MWVLALALQLGDPPGTSISFGFEPRVIGDGARNTALRDLGFAPLAHPVLPTFGLRGRAWLADGWVLGGTMSYGVITHARDDNPVPTVLSRIETGFDAGHQLGAGFVALATVGFAAQTTTVGSEVQGGALVELGPFLQARLAYLIAARRGSFVLATLGASVHAPVGRPHDNPLWEPSLRQPVLSGLIFGLESGFGVRLERWRARR